MNVLGVQKFHQSAFANLNSKKANLHGDFCRFENKINEDVIIQRIKEKIKFNPYVSYEQLIQLDTSTSINSVLEYLIDTKQLGVVKLDKENKYGKHKWRWK